MNRIFVSIAGATALGAALVAGGPVSAGEPASAGIGQVAQHVYPGESYAQYRYYGGRRYGGYYGGRGYRRGYGSAVGAGVAGLAAGALIGGAIASSQGGYYPGQQVYGAPVAVAPAYGYEYEGGYGGGDAVAYCAQRYRSYDPASGTFLANDGLRYRCP